MRETEKIWFNGELIDWADASPAPTDCTTARVCSRGSACTRPRTGPPSSLADRPPEAARQLRAPAAHGAPYSVEELRIACHDVVAANGLAECYLRPIAFYGYGELGVNPGTNPVTSTSSAGRGGPTSATRGLENGIRAKVSSLAADRPEHDPARRQGDGDLPELDARSPRGDAGGLRRGHPADRRRRCVADGSGENIFVIKDEILSTLICRLRSCRASRGRR